MRFGPSGVVSWFSSALFCCCCCCCSSDVESGGELGSSSWGE